MSSPSTPGHDGDDPMALSPKLHHDDLMSLTSLDHDDTMPATPTDDDDTMPATPTDDDDEETTELRPVAQLGGSLSHATPGPDAPTEGDWVVPPWRNAPGRREPTEGAKTLEYKVALWDSNPLRRVFTQPPTTGDTPYILITRGKLWSDWHDKSVTTEVRLCCFVQVTVLVDEQRGTCEQQEVLLSEHLYWQERTQPGDCGIGAKDTSITTHQRIPTTPYSITDASHPQPHVFFAKGAITSYWRSVDGVKKRFKGRFAINIKCTFDIMTRVNTVWRYDCAPQSVLTGLVQEWVKHRIEGMRVSPQEAQDAHIYGMHYTTPPTCTKPVLKRPI